MKGEAEMGGGGEKKAVGASRNGKNGALGDRALPTAATRPVAPLEAKPPIRLRKGSVGRPAPNMLAIKVKITKRTQVLEGLDFHNVRISSGLWRTRVGKLYTRRMKPKLGDGAGGRDCETNPILFKPGWKKFFRKPITKPNLEVAATSACGETAATWTVAQPCGDGAPRRGTRPTTPAEKRRGRRATSGRAEARPSNRRRRITRLCVFLTRSRLTV